MNREMLDRVCERGILGLVLAILVYGPLATGAVRTPDFLVLQGLTLGVMCLWAVRLWVSPKPQWLWPPVCWAVLAFAIYAVVRYFFADIEYVARQEMIQVVMYAFLFFAIINNLHRQSQIKIVTLTLIFLAMAISFYAIFQFVTDSDKVWNFVKPYPHRGSGTFISPNNLGGFLEMILPLGLAWTLVSRLKPVPRILAGYASLMILAGIAVSVSRGAWIATALVLLVLFSILIFRRTYRIPAALLLFVMIGAGIYFIPRTHFFKQRAEQLAAGGKIDDDARFDLWGPAVKLWKQNPWWGIGADHYNYRFRAFRPQGIQLQPDRVHNDYLNTLTDYGVAGFALVLAALALVAVGAFRTWPHVRRTPGDLGSKHSNKFALVIGASLGLLAILFHSVVDFNMHIPANAILAVTLLAFLSSAIRFATERWWVTARIWSRILATIALLGGMAYLSAQEVQRATEYAWLKKADEAPNFSPEEIAAREKAFAIEPKNFANTYAIAEAYRIESWDGGKNYRELAHQAMEWYKRGMALNPYDGYNYLRYGMCLDWIGKHDESREYYDRAVELDPNGYYTADFVGWHYTETGDLAAARTWFERSLRLEWENNSIANSYLKIVEKRMLEAATNSGPAALLESKLNSVTQ